jgi:hypothetical protein
MGALGICELHYFSKASTLAVTNEIWVRANCSIEQSSSILYQRAWSSSHERGVQQHVKYYQFPSCQYLCSGICGTLPNLLAYFHTTRLIYEFTRLDLLSCPR